MILMILKKIIFGIATVIDTEVMKNWKSGSRVA